MRAWLASVTLLLPLLLLPLASAEIQYVARTFDGDGRLWTNTTDDTFRNVTFQFNPDFYDTSTYSNQSIAQSHVRVTFKPEIRGFFPTYQYQEYRTSLRVNNTDYLNATITVDKPACFLSLCTLVWRQCFQFEYSAPALGGGREAFASNQTCSNSLATTFGPNELQVQYGWVSLVTEDRPPALSLSPGPSFFSVSLIGEAVPSERFSSDQLQVANFTNFTNEVILQTQAIQDNSATTELVYRFYTWDAADAEDERRREYLNNTKQDGAILENVLAGIFGGAKTALRFVLGWFPGGQDAADFIAGTLTAVIAVPAFAATIFFTDIPGFLLYHTTWYFGLGIVRYGTSRSADISAIWQTGFVVWRTLFRWIVSFGVWFYEIAVKLAQLIVTNTFVLSLVATVAGIGLLATLLS